MGRSRYRYHAFDMHLVSDEPLPGFLIAGDGPANLQVFFGTELPPVAQQKVIRREVPGIAGLTYETGLGPDAMEIRVLHKSGSIRVVIQGATVSFEWSDGIDVRTVKALFSGMILKSIALWRQKFALHAGAVELACGKSLVIAGQKGDGKSTLLAGFYAAGARIVAEDMAVLSRREEDWQVHSGARLLKLLPQAAAALVQGADETLDAGEWYSDHPGTVALLRNQKVVLDTTTRDGACGPESLPLDAIYLLGPRSAAGNAVAFERLAKPQAMALLAKHLSEVPGVLAPRENKQAAVQSLLALASDIPIYSLCVPNDLSRVQAIARQLMQGMLAKA